MQVSGGCCDDDDEAMRVCKQLATALKGVLRGRCSLTWTRCIMLRDRLHCGT